MTDDPFGDPRIAALYDEDNPPGDDHAFFRALADRIGARTIVDLGCGTGLLTVSYLCSTADGDRADGPSAEQSRERTVYGIDPSPAMLDVARSRDGGDRVRWRLGDARAIEPALGFARADLVTMTGNVAQHIIGTDWPTSLAAIGRALRPGGLLAFETRNPAARSWESWTREASYGSRDTAAGRLTEWLDLTTVDLDPTGATGGVITFTAHNVWQATGEHQALINHLQFRTRGELLRDLAAADLTPVTIDGGWHGEPVTETSPVFVVTATKPPADRTETPAHFEGS